MLAASSEVNISTETDDDDGDDGDGKTGPGGWTTVRRRSANKRK